MINQVEPNFDSLESEYIVDYLNSGGWATENKVTRDFEQKIANYVGMKHAIAVPSGTVALYLAVLSLNLKKGSYIGVPNLTMVATINAILWAGHIPVIIDTDEEMCLSLDSLMKVDKISALMYVPLNGKSGNAFEIKHYCQENKILLIEDSAHALGSKYDSSTPCGSLGDLSVISFTPHKIITTGQGGMILTNNKDFYNFLVQIKSFNRTKDKSDFHDGFGLNFKITDLQASLGLSQFMKLDNFISRKEEILKYYKENLKTDLFSFQPFVNYEVPWFFDIQFKTEALKRDFQDYLDTKGIETRDCYPALSTQPYLKKYKNEHLEYSENVYKKILWLPSGNNLDEDQLSYICKTVLQYI